MPHVWLLTTSILLVTNLQFSVAYDCGDGWILLHRKPTINNAMTSAWCLKPYIPTGSKPTAISYDEAKVECSKLGGIVSMPESRSEVDLIGKAIYKQVNKEESALFRVDGHIRDECIRDESCGAHGLSHYEFDDMNTDPTYLFGKWSAHTNSVLEKNFKQKPECVSFFFSQDSSFRTESGSLMPSHCTVFGGSINTSYALCGKAPTGNGATETKLTFILAFVCLIIFNNF